MDVALHGERVEHVDVAGRQAGETEQREAPGQRRRGRARRGGGRTPWRAARPGSGRRGARAGGATASACHATSGGRASPDAVGVVAGGPRLDHGRAVDAVAVEQVGEVADGAEAAGRDGSRRHRPRPRRDGRRAAPSRRRRGGRRRRSSAATPTAPGATDRCPGRRRSPPPPPRRRAGRGTGSRRWRTRRRRRPGDVPSTVESRWVSHRSMPRVGTATTSGVNGSSSGSMTMSARASTRRSARSARWIVNISLPAGTLSAFCRSGSAESCRFRRTEPLLGQAGRANHRPNERSPG